MATLTDPVGVVDLPLLPPLLLQISFSGMQNGAEPY
jgi:hypothetical protein